MDDNSSASTDPKSVLNALRSLAVTLDDYEEGANAPAGLDVEAISRRKDALGSLAAMLSQALSSSSDASANFDVPITEWSCCQTASIATRITKLADPTSEQLICRPTCTSGAGMLWWIANDLPRQLSIAQYRPATPEHEAQLLMWQPLQLPEAPAEEIPGYKPPVSLTRLTNPSGVHAVSDAGTAVLHDFRDHSLILCTIPSFIDQMHQANAGNASGEQQAVLSDYPTSRLSLAADPELPVYTSNDCTALATGSTQATTQNPNAAVPANGASDEPPLISAALGDRRSHPQSRAPPPDSHQEVARAAHSGADHRGSAPQAHVSALMDVDSDGDLEEGQECMMRMHSASAAATCRVSLGGSAEVDVVCGGGRFTFRRDAACACACADADADARTGSAQRSGVGAADNAPVQAPGAAGGGRTPGQQHHSGNSSNSGDGSGDGSGHSSGNGNVPPSESLPAVLCWVVPSAAADGAGDDCGQTHAVCALVDTGAGSHGTVTSVDVMAAGAGEVVVAFTTSEGRLVLWRLSLTAAPAAAAGAPPFACHRCEVLTAVDALPSGAAVAHHAWPLPQAHAMHAVCWEDVHGRAYVSLSAVVVKAPGDPRACTPLTGYTVHAVPCGDVGDVSAAAAGHGYVVVGSAVGVVAAWCCDVGRDAPVRVGGWGLDGQAVCAVSLAVEDEGLQVLVAMEAGDVYNFETGL